MLIKLTFHCSSSLFFLPDVFLGMKKMPNRTIHQCLKKTASPAKMVNTPIIATTISAFVIVRCFIKPPLADGLSTNLRLQYRIQQYLRQFLHHVEESFKVVFFKRVLKCCFAAEIRISRFKLPISELHISDLILVIVVHIILFGASVTSSNKIHLHNFLSFHLLMFVLFYFRQ